MSNHGNKPYSLSIIEIKCLNNLTGEYLGEFFIKSDHLRNKIAVYETWLDIDEGNEITEYVTLQLTIKSSPKSSPDY